MLINLVNVCQNDKVEIYLFDEALNTLNVNNFEEIIDEDHVDILIQNILIVEHVVDDNDKYVTIALGEGFQPLGLFWNTYVEEYNYPTLVFGHSRPHISCSYQKIAQGDLIIVNRKVAHHIINMFFKTIIF